jgi:hypothetical protein
MLTRTILVVGTTAVLTFVMADASLANGWGSVDCSQSPTPDCDLGAGTTEGNRPPAPNPDNGHQDQGNPGSGDTGGQPEGDTVVGGRPGAQCSYVPSDYRPPEGGVTTAAYSKPWKRSPRVRPASILTPAQPPPDQPGSWYVWRCTKPGAAEALYRPPIWIPNGQPAAASPEAVAEMARRQLHPPAPSIATNPVGEQLVNVPTWLWLSSRWEPVSSTASVPGTSVTAVATPTAVDWSMGDGTTITCHGPGTPFPSDRDPTAASPTCGHTYRQSSVDQPRQEFQVSAAVHWTVRWSGAGREGVFPDMTTTSHTAFRVAESHALNTGR